MKLQGSVLVGTVKEELNAGEFKKYREGIPPQNQNYLLEGRPLVVQYFPH